MLEKKCDINIKCAIELAHTMIELAQTGYEEHEDPKCAILYGILLDTGYRILDLAEKEKQAHISKGWWVDAADKTDDKSTDDQAIDDRAMPGRGAR